LRTIGPRIAAHFAGRHGGHPPERGILVWAIVFAFASALVTETIGIHALFGAFVAGVALSSARPVKDSVRDAIEPLAGVLLLPLFFASSGLRTEIGLLDGARNWLLCLAVVGVAVAGKFGGSAIAARWSGLAWRDALSIGALMNTRGLMELIVLNVGYDLGVLSPTMYTMMVVMALVTTCMTGPMLTAIQRMARQPSSFADAAP
jgi:Kef-type K+ transport system membrane component KefB